MFSDVLKKVVFTVILLSACFAATAQNSLDSLQHLQEVTVVGNPYKEIIPSQRLAGEQLEKLNSHSVADALRYFAGVQLKDFGGMGGLKTVNVRNMGTHHVGVFYDGIQLGNAQNGIVDLGKFSLDDMEEISLYNGQKSEIFQPAKDFASASAIYLKAKKPIFGQGEKTHLLVRYKAGSINLINPSVRWEQKLSKRVNMSLSGEYTKSDGKYKFNYKRVLPNGAIAYDTTATRHNSDIEAYRIETRVYGTIENGYWDAKLYYYQSDRGLPGAIVNNVFSHGERQKDKNLFAQASLTKEFTEQYKFQVKGKFAFDYSYYQSLDTISKISRDKYYQQEFYLSTVNMYRILRDWDVSLSVDFQYNKLNANRTVNTLFSFPQRYTTWASLSTSYNWGRLKAEANVLATFMHEKVRHNTRTPDKSEFTPAVFVGYKPFGKHDFSLRMFYKRIFRMPTFNDLYYAEVGYSNLKPEYTNQYNIGFTYDKNFKDSFLDAVALQADAYYSNVTDKIIAAPTGSQFRWMMSNVGKAKIKGVDAVLGASAHISKVWLKANLSYSYSDARSYTKINGIKLSSYGEQIPYTPWHSGSAVLNASFDTWSLNYSFIYVGKRYDGGDNNIAVNEVQPWYTHDISLQKDFTIRKKYKVKALVEMLNMFDQQYDVVLNYPMPGRNFRFTLSMEL